MNRQEKKNEPQDLLQTTVFRVGPYWIWAVVNLTKQEVLTSGTCTSWREADIAARNVLAGGELTVVLGKVVVK